MSSCLQSNYNRIRPLCVHGWAEFSSKSHKQAVVSGFILGTMVSLRARTVLVILGLGPGICWVLIVGTL